MAANVAPIFPITPKFATASLSAANTNLDGTTGAYTSLATIGANGGIVNGVTAIAAATNTVGAVRLFTSVDGGTTKKYWLEALMGAATISATTLNASATTLIDPADSTKARRLPASAIVYCTEAVANTINVNIEWGDY